MALYGVRISKHKTQNTKAFGIVWNQRWRASSLSHLRLCVAGRGLGYHWRAGNVCMYVCGLRSRLVKR
jgi:hypothetical protein